MHMSILGAVLLLLAIMAIPAYTFDMLPNKTNDGDTKSWLFRPFVFLFYMITGFKSYPEGVVLLVPEIAALYLFTPNPIYATVLLSIFCISIRLWRTMVDLSVKKLQ